MTTVAIVSRPVRPAGAEEAGYVPVAEPDPFVASQPSHRVADAPLRSRVVLHGRVLDAGPRRWRGGTVLEVTLSDGSGSIVLAFLGRRRIAGVAGGRLLTAAGTVASLRGRRVVLNPSYWLHDRPEVPGA